MFLNRRVFAALAVCLALSASTAFAGNNGGTKKDSTVTFTNNTNETIGVAVSPSASLLASTTPAEFVARGGKLLNAGDSIDFKVRAGSTPILAVDSEGEVIGQTNVTATKGGTQHVFVGDSGFTFGT
jgi:hypothetical protein